MRMLVRVVTPDDFDKWFENQKLKPAAAEARRRDRWPPRGKTQFKQQLCSSCHLIRGINDTKVAGLDRPGVKDPARLGRRAQPHPLRHPRHVRRLDLQLPLPEPGRREADAAVRPDLHGAGLHRLGTDAQRASRSTRPPCPTCPPANQYDAFDDPVRRRPGNPANPVDKVALAGVAARSRRP